MQTLPSMKYEHCKYKGPGPCRMCLYPLLLDKHRMFSLSTNCLLKNAFEVGAN